jgi:serine/threonine-protein kinase
MMTDRLPHTDEEATQLLRPKVEPGAASCPAPPAPEEACEPEDRLAAAARAERRHGVGEITPAEAVAHLQCLYRQERDPQAAARILAVLNRIRTPDRGDGDLEAFPVGLRQALGGRYLLDRRIAATRMSQVSLARRSSDGLAVAIKHLPVALRSEAARADFARETELLQQLQHPHLVSLLDSGLADGIPYLVMEYVEGGSLRDLVTPRGAEVFRVLRLALEVTEALTYLHDRGVIHLDIKPRNLLLDARDSAKVTDFGIARMRGRKLVTTRGGSPRYASPEQMQAGGDPDVRSDVYSLGVVLYQLLTGRLPDDPPAPPSALRPRLPAGLDRALLRALKQDPKERFGSAYQFAAALAVCLPNEMRW